MAICASALLALCLAPAVSWAAEPAASAEQAPSLLRYREGEHYKKVPIPVAPAAKSGVEVLEFFSYGCVHCFNFDPEVHRWSQEAGADVAFRRVPAVFNESWGFLAQAFFTAQALDVSEQLHGPLFRAIHTDNINIGDPKLMAELFRKHGGVPAEDFGQAFDSFGVRSKVQQATGQGRALRLRAVPSMVVAGQYVVDGSMVEGGNQEMLQVVEYLIDKVKSDRAAASAGQ
ncbi:MAG: thiol:disulfide interchange protein DsbA/DsbL [Pseudomonadales bacterium]